MKNFQRRLDWLHDLKRYATMQYNYLLLQRIDIVIRHTHNLINAKLKIV